MAHSRVQAELGYVAFTKTAQLIDDGYYHTFGGEQIQSHE